jgi:ABC-type glutathione transport system ATPase component
MRALPQRPKRKKPVIGNRSDRDEPQGVTSGFGRSDADAMVRTQALTKRYPGGERPPAVDRLDLDIRPGEIFGLLGPNGAGKPDTGL